MIAPRTLAQTAADAARRGKSVQPAPDDLPPASTRLLEQFSGFVPAGDVRAARGRDLEAFLDARLDAGRHPNTVRKERAVIRSFFAAAWRNGEIDAETTLSIHSVGPPPRSTSIARPCPYARSELLRLRRTLDERWPRLSAADERRWLHRWRAGRSPYSRVRSHAIRLQLEAVIVLALRCGLRRGEIFALAVDDAHYDNAYVVVRGNDRTTREVPYCTEAREHMEAWLEFRRMVQPDHAAVWLNLWARSTASAAMSGDTFHRLLATYLGNGWSLRRLRDTCAVEWLRAGLGTAYVQAIMGHQSEASTLPYLRAASGGSVQRHVGRAESRLAGVG